MNWRKPRLLLLGMLAEAVQAADVASPSVAQGGTGPAAGGVFSVLFGLIAVIAMIVGLAWMARRVGVTRPQDNALIQVIGAASLGTRERVAVVQIQDSWIVVGVSPAGVTSLATLPKGNITLPPGFASPAGFAGRLKSMLDARTKHA
jgi:flagellar protein FliO/FliZ